MTWHITIQVKCCNLVFSMYIYIYVDISKMHLYMRKTETKNNTNRSLVKMYNRRRVGNSTATRGSRRLF